MEEEIFAKAVSIGCRIIAGATVRLRTYWTKIVVGDLSQETHIANAIEVGPVKF